MRYISLVLSLIMISFSTLVQAQPLHTKISTCNRLPGIWFGSYTYKNKSDCEKANGCTQGVTLSILQNSANTFHVDTTTSEGIAPAFNITCEKNKINLPEQIQGYISVSCTQSLLCVAKFNDAKIFATVLNVKK